MKTKHLFLGLLVALSVCGASAQPIVEPKVDAFEQNRSIGRGVNILGYDPLWRSREHARFQAKYFALIRQAGFTSVRINLHPFEAMNATNRFWLSDAWTQSLNWTLVQANKQGLTTILDLHEYKAMGDDPAGNEARFLAFWRQIAQRYRVAPKSVIYELLNEPSGKLTPQLWNDYAQAALTLIRERDPNRTVIIGPGSWNSINHLDELKLPNDDTNLIVTVHYYEPMEFTHQGAPWANQKDKSGVEWRGTKEELDKISHDFDKAQAWANAHHRPLFLGEFGAYDKAPMDSRARYTAAVARAAEQRGWSWAYWQFDSDFVLYDEAKDAWVQPILQALIPGAATPGH